MPEPKPSRRLEILCLCVVLALHAVLLGTYHVPALGGPDPNGYHVSARMLEQHGRFYQVPEDDLTFVGRMWVVNERGEYYPKYPPLYSVTAAAVTAVFGGDAGLLVAPVGAWLAVLGIYVLCRTRLPGWAAVLAALAAATNPVLNALAIDQVSHGLSMACHTWGYALFFLGTEKRCRGCLFGSGWLLGYAVGVRYPNALIALPPLVHFALRFREGPRTGAVAWLGGAAIPGAFLAGYHWIAFGNPLTTGYSLTDEQSAFGLGHLVRHASFYLPSVVTDGVGPLLVLTCGGFAVAWLRDRRAGLFYTVWLGPLALLYMAYYWAPREHPVSYLRFLLPLGPPCLLLAALFLRDVVSRVRRPRAAALLIGAVVLAQTAWGVPLSLRHMEMRFRHNDLQHRRVEFVRQHVPAGSVLFGEEPLLEELDYDREYALRMEMVLYQDRLAERVESVLGPRTHPSQRARAAALKEALVDVDPATFRRRMRAAIEASIAGGREVYLVGGDPTRDAFRAAWGSDFQLQAVRTLPAGIRHRLLEQPAPTNPDLLAPCHVLRITTP